MATYWDGAFVALVVAVALYRAWRKFGPAATTPGCASCPVTPEQHVRVPQENTNVQATAAPPWPTGYPGPKLPE